MKKEIISPQESKEYEERISRCLDDFTVLVPRLKIAAKGKDDVIKYLSTDKLINEEKGIIMKQIKDTKETEEMRIFRQETLKSIANDFNVREREKFYININNGKMVIDMKNGMVFQVSGRFYKNGCAEPPKNTGKTKEEVLEFFARGHDEWEKKRDEVTENFFELGRGAEDTQNIELAEKYVMRLQENLPFET